MKSDLQAYIADSTALLGIDPASIKLEYPENPDHGDYATSVALANAKKQGMNPRALAEKIVVELEKNKPHFVESLSIAGPGFINIKIKDVVFANKVVEISKGVEKYGYSTVDSGKEIMVEYTDPNPFKVFHIGHLMSNAIGESISRLVQASGAQVVRANWQGDVGPHVAKAIWGALNSKEVKTDFASPEAFWGHAYAFGSKEYDANEQIKKDIDAINKKIYDRSYSVINDLYDVGRQESLDAFEVIYKRLGTSFNNYFFEGIEGRNGEAVVRKHLDDGIFTKSEGAIIFKGEDHGLHTRVFITSHGLPTYETKEIGLNVEKFKLYPNLAESIIITANEQSDYFRVLLKVFGLILPTIASKTRHISHGLMRFASGKMSSRKGNIISGETLINDIKQLVLEKIAGRDFSEVEKDATADIIAIGAIKYTILRQAIGGDVIFDSSASISFEGDSGPYLQYSAVRARSIVTKAEQEKIDSTKISIPQAVSPIEKLISKFPEIVERARVEYSPQDVAGSLIALASAFNSYYASNMIVDSKDPESPYRVALTKAFLTTMTNGLWILGIKIPEKM